MIIFLAEKTWYIISGLIMCYCRRLEHHGALYTVDAGIYCIYTCIYTVDCPPYSNQRVTAGVSGRRIANHPCVLGCRIVRVSSVNAFPVSSLVRAAAMLLANT